MGVNNHLWVEMPDGAGGTAKLDVQFRWGDVAWELEYHLGDRISWAKKHRPHLADGTVEVRGLALVNQSLDLRYFAITVDQDVIVGIREIDEAAYDALGEFSA